MNKLTTLYSLLVRLKEKKQGSGTMEGTLSIDDQPIATATGSGSCDGDHRKGVLEVRMGEERMRFEKEGRSGHPCCHEGIHRKLHGMKPDGGPHKLDAFLLMLKVLDRMELSETAEGRALIVELQGDELKRMHCCGPLCCEDGCGHADHFARALEAQGIAPLDLGTFAPGSLRLVLSIAPSGDLASATMTMAGAVQDTEGSTHGVTARISMTPDQA